MDNVQGLIFLFPIILWMIYLFLMSYTIEKVIKKAKIENIHKIPKYNVRKWQRELWRNYHFRELFWTLFILQIIVVFYICFMTDIIENASQGFVVLVNIPILIGSGFLLWRVSKYPPIELYVKKQKKSIENNGDNETGIE